VCSVRALILTRPPAAAAQIIGVGAAVVGDMSSRPYWGLYELDFVFSTLVVRCPCAQDTFTRRP